MEMPASESRRDSLEASLNDSFMDEVSFNNENLNATLDMSQVSGWSALTPGWNESFKIPLTDSESEEASDRVNDGNQEQEKLALKTSVHDLFIENCCTLYNDIQNAIDELEFVEQLQCVESLESRQNRLMEQAQLLAESAPDLSDIVQLRMQTINRAMEQLKIKQGNDSARSNSSKGHYGPSHQFRKWLQSVESQLDKFRSEIHAEQGSTVGGLQRLAADHQLLQLQIETEGQGLLSAAKKQFQIGTPRSDPKKQDRARRNLELLEQRLFSSWLKSLENLERIGFCLRQLQGPDFPDQSNLSEDEEPQPKRRRTLSDFSDISCPATQLPSSALSPCSTVDSDAQLIPSSTDSECGGPDPDTIPFNSADYVSFAMPVDLETKTYPTVENWAIDEIRSSCGKQLLDIGYSSGENSLTESPTVSSGGTSPDSERKIKLITTPTKSFYKTVPLDDGGLTDNENVPKMSNENDFEVELPIFDEPLSDSLIVQADNSLPMNDDYNEVMTMLDDGSETLFNSKIEELRKGTHWKELKSKNKRISTPRRSLPGLLNGELDKSREASSEESDFGKNKDPNSNPAALPPVPGRKRRFKKVIRQSRDRGGSMEILKNSLSNVAMDESIYVFTDSKELMSQSLNSSFNDSQSRRTILSKRKFDKTKIHRSASDHVNMNLSINSLSNSFHSQHSSTSVFASFLPNFGSPLMTSTLKKDNNHLRRPSVESIASSTSSGTVHETGDAHYEWDEYRDPPSLPDMSAAIIPDPAASTSSILDETLIDEDFQSQLSLPDPAGIDSALSDSRKNYIQIRRLIEDYDAFDEEKEDIRSALRSSAKQNLQKLTAIVQASPRNISMDQINEIEELRKEWKYTLEELGSNSLEEDQIIAKEIQSHLAEIKKVLEKLMETDVASLKLQDLETVIFERKSLWQKLMKNKKALNDLAGSTSNNYHNGELFILLKYVEDSLGFVGEGTDTLAESMVKYQSMGDVRQAMVELERKMDNMGGIGEGLVQQIQSELDLCQERLNVLETVCNNLTSQFGEIASLNGKTKPGRQTKFWREFKEFKSELERLKEKFLNVQKSSNLVNGTFGNVLRHRTSGVKESSTSTVSSTSDAEVQFEPQPGMFRRTIQSVKNSRFIQILLGLTGFLLLSLIFVTFYFDDTPQNNWRRMFGPQLEYINGPPPS